MTPPNDVTRRRFLKGAAVSGAAVTGAAVSGAGSGVAQAATGLTPPAGYPVILPLPFAHGVCSGDPLKDRVILWTRITLPDNNTLTSVAVGWEVRTDPGMTTPIVASGTVTTQADRDWTVKVDAGGLQPQTTYYYRFFALGYTSITGRTRTAVAALVSELRFAVVSCASYWSVVAWDGMARISERNDIDLIIHCGDHLYDYPDEDEWVRGAMDTTNVDFRSWETLAELRRRYAFYYADPDFLAMHQQHPLFILWDNHDLSNGNNNPATISDAEVVQAFWEWTPSRPPLGDGSGAFPPAPAGNVNVVPQDTSYVYRTLPYGPLADIRCWDVRKVGYDPTRNGYHGAPPAGYHLGKTQLDWFKGDIAKSKTAGTVWPIIVNGNPFGQFVTDNPTVASVTGSSNPLPDDYGAWDEFAAERSEIVQYLRNNKIDNVLMMTGDAHGNFLWDITEDDSAGNYNQATGGGNAVTGAGSSVGVEFLPTSLGRGGATETLASIAYGETPGNQKHPYGNRAGFQTYLDGALVATVPFDAAVMAQNASMQYLEWSQHGYGILHVTATKAVMEFWWQAIRTSATTDTLGAQFTIPLNANHPTQVVNPTATSGSRVSAQAPAPDLTPVAALPEASMPIALIGVGAAAAIAVTMRNRKRAGDNPA